MTRARTAILLLTLISASALAQQVNQNFADLRFNGINGPPWPITGVNLPRGVQSNVAITGQPNSAFIVAESSGVLPAGIPLLGGLVDLNFQNFAITLNGLASPLFNTGSSGTFVATFTVAPNVPLNSQKAFQAAVADFTVPAGASLTAATLVTVVLGVTTQSFNLTDNSSVYFDLTPFGFQLQFYNMSYTGVHISSNGMLSFGMPSIDPLPQTITFLSDMPRIAGFWTDLDPAIAGTIIMAVDQTNPLPFIRCDFNGVAEFLIATPHSFSMQVWAPPLGDIIITQSPFNIQSLVPTIVGITPGGNLSMTGSRDLSLMNVAPGVAGGTLENFHEFFPIPPPYSWDLSGRTISFFSSNLGTPQASYTCLVFP